MVTLLLNESPAASGYTVPIVVYGSHPLQTFNSLYSTNLKNYAPAVLEIIPGFKTPVLASSHPYVFYGVAQGFDTVGSGVFLPPYQDKNGDWHYPIEDATAQMQKDLAVAGWLKAMSDDPSQDVAAVWSAMSAQWLGADQQPTVNALVTHQGSLFYKDKDTLAFKFNQPLVWPTSAILA